MVFWSSDTLLNCWAFMSLLKRSPVRSPVTSEDFTTTRDITRFQYIKDPPHNLTFYCIQTKVTSLLALDKLFEPSQSFSLHGLLWPALRLISCFRQSLVLEHGAVHRSGLGHCLPLVADICVIEIHIFKQFLVRFSTFASHSLHSPKYIK